MEPEQIMKAFSNSFLPFVTGKGEREREREEDLGTYGHWKCGYGEAQWRGMLKEEEGDVN